MQVGDNVSIMVGEPWDFESPMGANKITGVICDRIFAKYGDTYLLKSDKVFEIKSVRVQYMIMTHRYKKPDFISFNIAYIPDECVLQFHNLDAVEEQIIPIVIGTLKSKI